MKTVIDIHELHSSQTLPCSPASSLKNEFKRVFQQSLESGPVSISRNRKREAILLPVELYDRMIEELASQDPLETLKKDYDDRFQSMQSGDAHQSYQDAFSATPDELGQAAVQAVTKHS